MENFERRFLRARDGALTPRESWTKKRANPYYQRQAKLCFVHAVEDLKEEDYAEVMCMAAMAPSHVALLEFRLGSDMEVAKKWAIEGLNHLKVWRSPHLYDGIAMGLDERSRKGYFLVGLFWPSDPPPEHQNFIFESEVHTLLGRLGRVPTKPPKDPTRQ